MFLGLELGLGIFEFLGVLLFFSFKLGRLDLRKGCSLLRESLPFNLLRPFQLPLFLGLEFRLLPGQLGLLGLLHALQFGLLLEFRPLQLSLSFRFKRPFFSFELPGGPLLCFGQFLLHLAFERFLLLGQCRHGFSAHLDFFCEQLLLRFALHLLDLLLFLFLEFFLLGLQLRLFLCINVLDL